MKISSQIFVNKKTAFLCFQNFFSNTVLEYFSQEFNPSRFRHKFLAIKENKVLYFFNNVLRALHKSGTHQDLAINLRKLKARRLYFFESFAFNSVLRALHESGTQLINFWEIKRFNFFKNVAFKILLGSSLEDLTSSRCRHNFLDIRNTDNFYVFEDFWSVFHKCSFYRSRFRHKFLAIKDN
jgi:hypothetical protein